MEKSSFFNAELVGESYDRTYLAEDYVEYFASFIGNGVFPNPSTNLQVLADGTNMNVVLKSGKAWINGYYYRNTDELILPIAPADGVLNRIDRVVLRLDFLNREIKAYVKKGVFASNPVAIELQRDADMYEIGIADIKVNKGIIKIAQADITDLRQNSNYCGIVHGTVDQVDVTTLFNQYEKALELKEQGFEEEFTAWFNNIKGQLEGDVATNLAGQIENINSQLGDMTQVPTTSKTASGAITELFINVDSGKNAISGAITDVDSSVVIPTNPTFEDLASAIGNISTGKKWASGTLLSSASALSYIQNGTSQSRYPLTVTGLNFTPKFIYIFRTINPSDISFFRKKEGNSGIIGISYNPDWSLSSAFFYTDDWSNNIVLGANNFQVPTSKGNENYTWLAIE